MWDFKLKSFLHDLKHHREKPPAIRKGCDIPGCEHLGEYRAPKSRYDLQNYYWFCLDHVRDYNNKWDYFKGMSSAEVENHIHTASVWDRPTWRMTEAGLQESKVRQKVYEHFKSEGIAGDFFMGGEQAEAHINISAIPHPTIEALAVMNLAPVQWDEVKARYKTLAKKYHPDTNKGDKDAEELFKKINLAYTILKLSYQNYTELGER